MDFRVTGRDTQEQPYNNEHGDLTDAQTRRATGGYKETKFHHGSARSRICPYVPLVFPDQLTLERKGAMLYHVSEEVKKGIARNAENSRKHRGTSEETITGRPSRRKSTILSSL